MITSPLPLFPLGLVLLPGASVPLHIFESRYRDLLRDVLATTRSFGLISAPPGTTEDALPAGRIGCIARIVDVETMPDGRSNIVIEGVERFRFERYVDTGTPYRMGEVAAWDDTPDDSALVAAVANRVRDLALRAVRASMTIHDVTANPPTLASEPSALSFQVAHMLRTGIDVLYGVLEDRSVAGRLARLDTVITRTLAELEGAAELHVRAKTNGHHHGPPPG